MENIAHILPFIFGSIKGIALLCLSFPLLAFVLLMFVKNTKSVNSISISIGLISFISSLLILYHNIYQGSFTIHTPWLTVGNIVLEIGITVDRIASLMLSMVSFVALMVIVFSTSYLVLLNIKGFKKEEMIKMRRYADLYGSALPMQLTIERNALGNMRRMAPLKSNNFGLNLHTGNYEKMEFKDYLGKNKAFDVDENLLRKLEKTYLD